MSHILLATILIYSQQYKIDPLIVASLIDVESSWNENAVGKHGERGLLQLRPKYFPYVEGNEEANLKTAISHLAEIRERCPHKLDNTWVLCHNLGVIGASRIKNPKTQTYYKNFARTYAARKQKIEAASR